MPHPSPHPPHARPRVAAAGANFGGAVALRGNLLLVGAAGEASCSTDVVENAAAHPSLTSNYPTNGGCESLGAAYVFVRGGDAAC